MSAAPARLVVSTGRCGSTLLSRMLACHPGVLSLSEVFAALAPNAFPPGRLSGAAFWRMLATPALAWTRALRDRLEPDEWRYPVDAGGRWSRETGVPPLLTICLPSMTDDADTLFAELEPVVSTFPAGVISEHYRAMFGWLAERFGRGAWVERSGGSLLYAGEIARAFPDARIVHLFRDGRETALSMRDHPFFRLQILPDGADPATPVAAERFGCRWSASILHGLRGLDRLPAAQVLHIDYADLVRSPARSLERVATFFELPQPAIDWVPSASGLVVPQAPLWPELAEPERTQLARACAVGDRRLRALASA